MRHIQNNTPFNDHLKENKHNVDSMRLYIQRINRRISQLQMADQRTITTTDSKIMLQHWTTESHKAPMFIAPVTNHSDIPIVTPQDDHRRRDYHYTLHHTDAHTAEPIPLIHWLMAQKGIYEKCLATLNRKKRPGSQKQRAH